MTVAEPGDEMRQSAVDQTLQPNACVAGPGADVRVVAGDRYETLTWNLVMASHRRDKDEKQEVAEAAERVGWLNGTQGLVSTLFVNCVHNAHPGGITADGDPMWLDKFGERCVTKHEWVRWYAGADFASAFVLNVLADRSSEMAEDFKKMSSSIISRYRVTLIEVLVDDYLRRPDETFEAALLRFMRLSLRTKHQQIELGSLTLPYPPADPDTWEPPAMRLDARADIGDASAHAATVALPADDMPAYRLALQRGATHDQVIAAYTAGIYVSHYGWALKAGASHDQIVAANAAGVDLIKYQAALKVGASHDEIIAAAAAGISLDSVAYTGARTAGASHDEVLAAHAAGIDVSDYRRSRAAGASHDEVLAAAADNDSATDMHDQEVTMSEPTTSTVMPEEVRRSQRPADGVMNLEHDIRQCLWTLAGSLGAAAEVMSRGIAEGHIDAEPYPRGDPVGVDDWPPRLRRSAERVLALLARRGPMDVEATVAELKDVEDGLGWLSSVAASWGTAIWTSYNNRNMDAPTATFAELEEGPAWLLDRALLLLEVAVGTRTASLVWLPADTDLPDGLEAHTRYIGVHLYDAQSRFSPPRTSWDYHILSDRVRGGHVRRDQVAVVRRIDPTAPTRRTFPTTTLEPWEVTADALAAPDVSVETLDAGVVDGSWWVRKLAVEHPNSEQRHLDAVASDPAVQVRLAVAASPKSQSGHLAPLCFDPVPIIRHTAAKHPNTGIDAARRALLDKDKDVRRAARRNLADRGLALNWEAFEKAVSAAHKAATPQEIEVYLSDSDPDIRAASLDFFAQHKKHPTIEQLQRAATDEAWAVRYVAATSGALNDEQLEMLTSDPDDDVCRVANIRSATR